KLLGQHASRLALVQQRIVLFRLLPFDVLHIGEADSRCLLEKGPQAVDAEALIEVSLQLVAADLDARVAGFARDADAGEQVGMFSRQVVKADQHILFHCMRQVFMLSYDLSPGGQPEPTERDPVCRLQPRPKGDRAWANKGLTRQHRPRQVACATSCWRR